MLDVIRKLMLTAGSERDPAEWATRLMAHAGLGGLIYVLGAALLTLLGAAPALVPVGSLFLTGAVYFVIEMIEWKMAAGRRGIALFFDCVLDWVGVVLLSVAFFGAHKSDVWLMVSAVLALIVILLAGVSRRRARQTIAKMNALEDL